MKAWRFLTFVYFAVLIRRRSEEHTSELQSPCNLVCRIIDRKSTRLNSSHLVISYAVFCLKKKNTVSRIIVIPNRTYNPNLIDDNNCWTRCVMTHYISRLEIQ